MQRLTNSLKYVPIMRFALHLLSLDRLHHLLSHLRDVFLYPG